MSDTKHTPGPWKANFVISGAAYIFGGDRNFARVFNEWQDEANREANARLIAAAPELLEALESIAEFWNRDQNEKAMIGACWHAIETAEAAIAKAKGEQP